MTKPLSYFSLLQTREVFLRHFLFVCLLVLTFYVIFDIFHQFYLGAFTDFITGIAVGVSFFSICKHGIKNWHIHLTLLGGICLFAPLLIIEAFGETGIYWLPTMPVLTFMLGGTRVGLMWAIAYIACLLLSILLASLGFISLQYTWDQTSFMMFVTIFMGVISYFFVRYLEETEVIFLLQQKQLEQAVLEAQSASDLKSQFLSTISHELRTPLHGIIGMQELLAKENIAWTAEQRGYLQLSLDASKSLKHLLNDVLDLAKIEANQMLLEEKNVDILVLTRESLLPFIFHIKEKGVQLHLVLDDIPKWVTGDIARLRQILFNLLGNAVKFTEHGSIRLKVERDSLVRNQLKFSIQDTGIGIPSEEVAHVFEAFYQCSNSPHAIKGTGLGTSIIKQSVELLGGKIELRSELNKGSCFTFYIPYKSGDQESYSLTWDIEDITKAKKTNVINRKADESTEKSEKLRVLLVDDDRIGLRIAMKTLKQAGIDVEAAEHGQEALNLLEKNSYDVMLTDLRMPCMDGITLTRLIRAQEKETSRYMPIIGLSAHALSSAVDEAMAAGMDEFLLKPIEPSAILDCVLQTKNKFECA